MLTNEEFENIKSNLFDRPTLDSDFDYDEHDKLILIESWNNNTLLPSPFSLNE